MIPQSQQGEDFSNGEKLAAIEGIDASGYETSDFCIV